MQNEATLNLSLTLLPTKRALPPPHESTKPACSAEMHVKSVPTVYAAFVADGPAFDYIGHAELACRRNSTSASLLGIHRQGL
jgi:hypothetical protein